MARRNNRRRGARSGAGVGCILWLVAMVAIAFIFLLNLDKIKATFQDTKFLEILKTRRSLTSTTSTSIAATASPGTTTGKGSSTGATVATGTTVARPPLSTSLTTTTLIASAVPASSTTRAVSLFFVRIEDDGAITRQEVKRAINVADQPLTDTITALVAGPTEGEIRRKIMTLIPHGTKLLGLTIRDGTAFINLNDAFMYNKYGIEGYAGQLKQLVYTATAWPDIRSVQVLIDGKIRDYLGGEGVYIGKPLSRSSF